MISGYTGISFPFRVGITGGVQMSTTDKFNAQHIMESIQQILTTDYSERPMEMGIYSNVDYSLFEPNDEVSQELLAEEIVDAIERLDERVSLSEDDVSFYTVETSSGETELYCNLVIYVEDYETSYTLNSIRLGVVQ